MALSAERPSKRYRLRGKSAAQGTCIAVVLGCVLVCKCFTAPESEEELDESWKRRQESPTRGLTTPSPVRARSASGSMLLHYDHKFNELNAAAVEAAAARSRGSSVVSAA